MFGGANNVSCIPTCFQGGIKRITIYSGAMIIPPPPIPIDECNNICFKFKHYRLCWCYVFS